MKSFTFIETITAIFVFSLFMGIVFSSIFILYQTHSYQWQQSLAISEARKGIEIMTKEIRKVREGENGNYPIEYAGDKEFIFYSDVDNDGKTERVRYFLGRIETQVISKECQSDLKGGSCFLSFSDFLNGTLKVAILKISVQGDLNSSYEYLTVNIDNQTSTIFCQTENCRQCPTVFEEMKTFNIKELAQDGSISILVQASCPNPNQENRCVDPICPFSFKVKFELTISQEIQTAELKKGVIKATGTPPTYPLDQEQVSVITRYVRNAPPIFEYFDQEGNKLEDYPARLQNTKVMKLFLVINVDPNKPPDEYQLESYVQIRNLKSE